MARKANSKSKSRTSAGKRRKKKAGRRVGFRPVRWVGFIVLRATTIVIVSVMAMVVIYSFVNPPTTQTIWSESRRLGGVERKWVEIEKIAPVMGRSVVAAEDANFCQHWGFDVAAIRAAMEGGGARGGSTITQQVVKNVFLWQGRSWVRKLLEAAITPAVEAVWSKRRIVEVYLNVAEFGEGVFGVDAAAKRFFSVTPDKLGAEQAALIAAVLPAPKTRSAARPDSFVQKRARAIEDGAATIRADGRSACFED
jgi:monofunctional glycosyltransferase